MKISRTRRYTFNLGGFENYIVEAAVESDVTEPVDVVKVSTQLNQALDTLLYPELVLVDELSANKDSFIFEHPLLKDGNE